MDTIEAIKARKSVRQYSPEQLSAGQLKALTDAALCGPGGAPLHVAVIQNADLIKTISDAAKAAMLNSGSDFSVKRASLPGYEPCYSAPTLLLFCSPKGSDAATASCAAENVLIAATELGLGSCYLMSVRGAFAGKQGAELAAQANIPDGFELICGAIAGYKAGDAFTGPKQDNRTISYVK